MCDIVPQVKFGRKGRGDGGFRQEASWVTTGYLAWQARCGSTVTHGNNNGQNHPRHETAYAAAQSVFRHLHAGKVIPKTDTGSGSMPTRALRVTGTSRLESQVVFMLHGPGGYAGSCVTTTIAPNERDQLDGEGKSMRESGLQLTSLVVDLSNPRILGVWRNCILNPGRVTR